ncbi:hypothetical protein [Caulobacter sp.]|uniref:hypothetical protein n=1 Tax=Caulobacter sp. TaxID=78 RepID=UPI001B1EC8E4|nr:hypothetical protein [Caulobacter sp.]MBO9546493.1 hypothetical protein [Caulobacter sp.]
MSKLVRGLTAAVILASTLVAAHASAQPGQGGPKRRDICGAPITGQAPDIMTYDSTTGTQVFVGGGRGGSTDVAAYNAQTGSAAGLTGDLSRPGLVSSCAVDGITRESYSVTSDRPGQVSLSGRDDRGERYQFTRSDGRTEIWDPRYENRCFRSGLGLGGGAPGRDPRC